MNILVLSPHLDDAGLDCADHIVQWKDRGDRVKVITVFSSYRTSVFSLDANKFMRLSGFDSLHSFEAERKREDIKAMKMLCVEWAHLNFVDGGFRTYKNIPVYSDYRVLFSGRIAKEDRIIERKLTIMPQYLQSLILADFVCVPFGIGNHADHLIVRRVAESIIPNEKIVYYVDYPYALKIKHWRIKYVQKILQSEVSILSMSDNKRKVLGCYSSQTRLMFRQDPKYLEVLCYKRV